MTRAAAPSFSGSTRQCVVNGRRRFEHVVREFASRTLYQNQQKSTQRQRNKVKLTGNKRGGDWSYKHDRSRARSKTPETNRTTRRVHAIERCEPASPTIKPRRLAICQSG